MAGTARTKPGHLPSVGKSATGIRGLDEVTQGGLPQGRPSLLCGSAGCGKTLFAMTFLYNGVIEYNEPGVFLAFEERPADLIKNVGSLNYEIERLIAEKKLAIDHVEIERTKIAESGEYDLEGLFIRLGYAIDSIGAKRVVVDTIETLFSGLEDEQLLRSELRRLFEWLKSKGVTAIITAERGEGTLTRYGLEEYVADCVILLDNRVHDQLSTRRLRIIKYRGSAHGTNEYPFIIDEQGITVMPLTSTGLAHEASTERLPPAFPISTRCWRAKAISKVPASWYPAWPAAANRLWQRILPRRPARPAIVASISRWKNRSSRSSAICVRSASTCKSGSTRSCCGSARGDRPCSVSKPISRPCTAT